MKAVVGTLIGVQYIEWAALYVEQRIQTKIADISFLSIQKDLKAIKELRSTTIDLDDPTTLKSTLNTLELILI